MNAYDAAVAHFLSLSPQQQAEAIARLAALGWTSRDIGELTRLSIEQVESLLLAEQVAA